MLRPQPAALANAATSASKIQPEVMRRHVDNWFDSNPDLDLGNLASGFGLELDVIPDWVEKAVCTKGVLAHTGGGGGD